MSDGFGSLDAHAYVDNSLNPADRAAFDAAMRRDARLRARVDAWEAQNEAIRLAFGGAPRPARHAPPAVGRPSNENDVKPPLAEPPRPLRGRERNPQPVKIAPPPRHWRLAATGALALLLAVSFAGGPPDPREALMRRADAAFRAASAFADTRLDFVSDDPAAISAWLGGRFPHVEPRRLKSPGWSLLGVRIVPGADAAAALVLYEDALGGRAGLLLEPTDAWPQLPPIRGREGDETLLSGIGPGYAYAAVGPTRSGVGALIPPAREN